MTDTRTASMAAARIHLFAALLIAGGPCAAAVTEESLAVCERDSHCMVVPYQHCCGSTKRAINRRYQTLYESRPDWQKFDSPQACAVMGACLSDKSHNAAVCAKAPGRRLGECQLTVSPSPAPAAAPRKLSPRKVSELVERGRAVIVDVREDEERREVIGGARSLPMSRADDDKAWKAFVTGLPADKTIVFHCAAGVRAKRAAEKLSKEGFSTGYFKGPGQWKAEGLPVEPGPTR